MMRRQLNWLRRQYVWRRRRYLDNLRKETVEGYQRFYYPMIMTAGLYLWLGADQPTTALRDTLGDHAYNGWLLLHFVCPPVALYGRHRFDTAKIKADKLFGARLQLLGDGGVWAAICIYVACLANTFYWGQAIYPSFFLFMGVPGGFRFTMRSWQRLRETKELEQ